MAQLARLNLVAAANRGTPFVPTYPTLDETGEYPPILGGDGAPATITLLGADSDVARRLTRQQRATLQNRMAALAFTGKAQHALSEQDIAEQEAHDLELVVACTVAWSGFEDDDGAPLSCTPENARALYESAPYLVEQAMRHLRDRARFFDPSSRPSAAPPTIGSASANATEMDAVVAAAA